MIYNLNMKLGKKLGDYRRKVGLTQEVIGKRMKVKPSHVSAIETGQRGDPQWSTIARYLNALPATLDRVLNGK